MIYSESELDSNFVVNSVSDIDSASESDSESGSSLAVMNLDICIFFILYLHPSKLTCEWVFFIHSHNRINSYASNASIMHIFF